MTLNERGNATVVEVEWREYERGWGQRPDGYSYFITMEDAEKYVKEYKDEMPIEVPECYSMPMSFSYAEVNPVFALMIQNKGTVWTDNSQRI